MRLRLLRKIKMAEKESALVSVSMRVPRSEYKMSATLSTTAQSKGTFRPRPLD